MNTMSIPDIETPQQHHNRCKARVWVQETKEVNTVRKRLKQLLNGNIEALMDELYKYQRASRANCFIGNMIVQLKSFNLEE